MGALPLLEVEPPEPETKKSVQKVAPINPDRSRTEAAKIAGTNHAYVNAAEKIKETAPDLFDKLKSGNITMQDAANRVHRWLRH